MDLEALDRQAEARGVRAFNELEEVRGAFDAVEQAILTEIGQTPLGMEGKVLNLHRALHNLAAVRAVLQIVISNGMTAKVALSQAGLTRPV